MDWFVFDNFKRFRFNNQHLNGILSIIWMDYDFDYLVSFGFGSWIWSVGMSVGFGLVGDGCFDLDGFGFDMFDLIRMTGLDLDGSDLDWLDWIWIRTVDFHLDGFVMQIVYL